MLGMENREKENKRRRGEIDWRPDYLAQCRYMAQSLLLIIFIINLCHASFCGTFGFHFRPSDPLMNEPPAMYTIVCMHYK